MATKTTSATKSKPAATKKATAPAATKASAATGATLRPVKETFTKASLTTHIAERAGLEPKAVKAVIAALEETVLGAVHKKGAQEFTLSGLFKIGVQQVPAKKKRFGKDPFTGEDRWFDPKPATVRIKVRALKKLKDAAL